MKTQNIQLLTALEKSDITNLVKEASVKETVARVAEHKAIFTAADYWNLQRSRRTRTGRRFLMA
ncbi:hypothetical protein [Asinibacterium sp. OR53]|jgi:hypothetical protein|uniref:hypothetical protein n=1 Tax=Asinibacterium sp. OR53 TaxID=925409 RepID=UPI00047DBEF6|nr:hypothetical protein [Asinibacterium sp. OR53]MBN8719953.1 hypothetical protein [Sediminibacterium magnilacihabitans]PQV60777.1 hypothetical protein CLV53_10543 [Sediminibacterium magnilacihabitans]